MRRSSPAASDSRSGRPTCPTARPGSWRPMAHTSRRRSASSRGRRGSRRWKGSSGARTRSVDMLPGVAQPAGTARPGGGSAARPSAVSSRRTACGSVAAPRIRRGPAQRGQTRTLSENTRRRSVDHDRGPGARGRPGRPPRVARPRRGPARGPIATPPGKPLHSTERAKDVAVQYPWHPLYGQVARVSRALPLGDGALRFSSCLTARGRPYPPG
jgi:hypothetical protein